MAEATGDPKVTYERLAWAADWHVREETYQRAIAEVVNAHYRPPFSQNRGEGRTSSSDGQVLRLMASIRTGPVTAFLILKKLANYPGQNGLAKALREVGKIERTLFGLAWYQDLDLRKRVNAGLNKGEARNALARAVFFNRLGELLDRSYEDQQGCASGLALPCAAAIALWNAVHLERAVAALRARGEEAPAEYLRHPRVSSGST